MARAWRVACSANRRRAESPACPKLAAAAERSRVTAAANGIARAAVAAGSAQRSASCMTRPAQAGLSRANGVSRCGPTIRRDGFGDASNAAARVSVVSLPSASSPRASAMARPRCVAAWGLIASVPGLRNSGAPADRPISSRASRAQPIAQARAAVRPHTRSACSASRSIRTEIRRPTKRAPRTRRPSRPAPRAARATPGRPSQTPPCAPGTPASSRRAPAPGTCADRTRSGPRETPGE